MIDYLLDFMVLPMPILWLLLLGVVLWRWRRLSRAVIFAAIALFLAVSLPASGKLLVSSLQSGAPTFDGDDPGRILGILVPSGGTFDGGTGRWWPTQSSARRVAAALRIRDRLGLPIILSGGSPSRGQPPEVETIATLYGLQGEHIRLDTRSRNSSETAEAVAAMLAGKPNPQVILVTSATHIARMSAVLRHNGVTALVMPADDDGLEPLSLSDFLPSYRGLKLNRAAQWEFMGIAWYLVTDRIDFADLSPS
ncbi:MAG: YdcF family protein [Proteobacteria bacterium]|nr:YdcF family protein [Pseudomonadota bacterium]